MYEYKCIPVAPTVIVKGKNHGQQVAQYLEDIINKEAYNGWEYQCIDTFTAEEPAGCLAIFSLSKNKLTSYYVATFRRAK